jgi:peptidoglycan/xylan/chitin deacetylase (PgdA/CDA1 family)
MKAYAKQIAAIVLYKLGLLQLLIFLEYKFGWKKAVLVCTYHQINIAPPSQTVSGFEVGTTAATLDRQVGELRKWITPIDVNLLTAWLAREVNLEDDGFIPTFDDGYQDNLTIAAPILQKHNVSPVVFVSTDYVDTSKMYWWIRLTAIMKQIGSSSWRKLLDCDLSPELKQIIHEIPIESWNNRVEARRKIADVLVTCSDANLILDRFECILGQRAPNPLPVLTWNEIRELKTAGFSIGAHTHTHRLLSRLASSDIIEEFRVSNKILSDHLGQWSHCLAYPAGDFDDRVTAAVESCGYLAAFTTRPGLIYQASCRYTLPRIYLTKTSPHEICFFVFAAKVSKYLPEILARKVLEWAA